MRCHVSNCLGHADERTAEVRCTRCQGVRWVVVTPIPAPDPTGYVCRRCQAAVTGRYVVDPLPTEANRAAGARLQAGRNRHDQAIPLGKRGGIPAGEGSDMGGDV